MKEIKVITRENYSPTLSVRECEDFIRENKHMYYISYNQIGINLIVRNGRGFLLNNEFEDIELAMNVGVEAVKEAKDKRFNRRQFLEELLRKTEEDNNGR